MSTPRPTSAASRLVPERSRLGRLQVGPSLQPREFRIADRGENHPEEGLPDPWHPSQQQVARVDLPRLILVVRGRDFRQQDDISQSFLGLVADQRLAAFLDNRLMKLDRFLKV